MAAPIAISVKTLRNRRSFTRTIIRNIILISAKAVSITKTSIRARRSRLKGSGIPAISEPTVSQCIPEKLAVRAEELNWSVLSSMRAMRAFVPDNILREKLGGICSTALSRPLRRSRKA
ncbi:MAG: hypothetical protein V2B20_00515 [Pseudomonadota bacterium]